MNLLSQTKGKTIIPLLDETIGDNLKNTVIQFPDCDAIISTWQNYRVNYRELWQQTTQVAKAILASGVKKGDRVAIWAMNRYEWVLMQYAIAPLKILSYEVVKKFPQHQ